MGHRITRGSITRHRLIGVASAASVAALTIALSASPASAASSVAITNFAYAPPSLTVPAGTSVAWTNQDPVGHSVTSDTGAFDSSPSNCSPTLSSGCIPASGGTFSFTFSTPGTFTYHCRVHSVMHGTIVVTGVTTTTTAPVITAPTTTPPTTAAGSPPTTASPTPVTSNVAAATATTTAPALAVTGATDLGRLSALAAGLVLAGGLATAAGSRRRRRTRP